jgi:RNA polymerase sigma-70 factor (ECF subfamily)
VLGGDADACRLLVTRHQRSVHNLLARLLRDPAEAEDLAQETFVRAFRHLATFDPRYKFSSWLLRIARNAGIDALRRRAPIALPLDGEEGRPGPAASIPAPAGEDGLKRLERQDLSRALEEALGRLRPEYRELVVLRYHEDLGYDEIAEITGLPLGTIKSWLHRARAEMAEILADRGWRPGATSCNPGAR